MYALIQVLSGPEEGLSLLLKEGASVQVGRGPKNDLTLAHDSYISTAHAQIIMKNGAVQIQDLRSSNGSVVGGRRIQAHVWHEVETYFVLGSTPFHVTRSRKALRALSSKPVRVAEASWGKSRLVSKALEIVKTRGQMHLDSVSLLLAVIDLFPEAIAPKLKDLGIQPQAIFETWRSLKIFEGSRQWLNNYLELQSTLPKPPAELATPKVAHFLKKASPRRGLSGEVTLVHLLGDAYNLAYPLLEWRRLGPRWRAFQTELKEKLKPKSKNDIVLKKSVAEPEPETKKASVGAQIDLEISAILKKGHIVELTGEEGCGKSRVLNRFFDAQFMRADESRERFLPVLVDIRTFLSFHQVKELPRFLKKTTIALGKAPLVGVDHFDELLEVMKQELIDPESLFQAIHQRNCDLVIVTSRQGSFKKGTLHGVRRLDVASFSLLLRQSVIDALIRKFERESSFRISAENRKWLNEQLWDMANNYHSIRQVFDLAAAQARDALEQRQKWSPGEPVKEELEKFIFQKIIEDTTSDAPKVVEVSKPLPPPTPPESIPALTSPDPGSVMDFVYQVEDFIKAFVEEEFHLGLDYTDRTYSIRESGILTQKEKLQQLKSFLVFLLSSYRESFRVWFQKLWNQIDPQVLKSLSGVGNNSKKLWQEYQQRAGKIDMGLAEDQFIEAAAEAFRRSWREAKRSQVPPIPPRR